MKYSTFSLKNLFLMGGFFVSFFSYAIDSKALETQANSSIQELYHTLNTKPTSSIAERIDLISAHYLGTVYELGSLGEGSQAKYDQFPEYRVDSFDCDTYVNTVLALALAHSIKSFKQCLRLNRYQNGNVSYITRNHFTDLDWNKNNQLRGVLKGITMEFKNKKNQSVAQCAMALINKPNWYNFKTISTIRLQHENKTKQEKLLAELKNEGARLEIATAKISYLPLHALFPKNKPDHYLFSQIPNGAIIEIVRPNWDLRKVIGTSLNISHLGFAIWINDKLYFRQASSQKGKVSDVPLIDYLQEAQKSPTIKGINVQIVPLNTSLSNACKV